jgi:hypothetical protein
MVPTASDTITIITSFTLTSTAAPTNTDKTNLKQAVADALSVTTTEVKNFVVTSTSSRRRKLLTTYTWTTSFDVTVSLSSTSSSTSAAFSTFVATTLGSTSFSTDVTTATGGTLDTGSVTTSVATRAPTAAPTITADDDDKSDKKSTIMGFDQATLGIAVIAFLVLVLGGVGAYCFLKNNNKVDLDAKEKEAEMSQYAPKKQLNNQRLGTKVSNL